MTESFNSFIMDDMLCNTSTIWPTPNPYNPADCLLDALLNGNFNQIPAPLEECSLAPQLSSLADSSLVAATTAKPSALYCAPELIENDSKLESLIHVKSYTDLVQSIGDRRIPMASFHLSATSDLSTATTAADCQDNLALRELQYANEVPLFTVSTAQTERTQEHQRNHNLFQDLRSKEKLDSGILPGLDILTCFGDEEGNQGASAGFMLHRSRLNSPSSLSVTENGHNNSDDVGQRADALREMIYRLSAMQPVNIDPSTIARPKRRNVRISKDPQSVAARHRREKISDRIRILQRLVPGGTKMDTASMLDEAIHYVKFLKRQVQVLESASSKLCDPRLNRSQLGSYNNLNSSSFYPTSLSSSLNPSIASTSAFGNMSKKMFLHRGYSIVD